MWFVSCSALSSKVTFGGMSLFELLLGEKDMLVDDGIVFHELQFVGRVFGVLSCHIVVSRACIGHQPDQNAFSLRHFGSRMVQHGLVYSVELSFPDRPSMGCKVPSFLERLFNKAGEMKIM